MSGEAIRVTIGGCGGWILTMGFRTYWGGTPLPMGSYGVLDPMARRSGDSSGHSAH